MARIHSSMHIAAEAPSGWGLCTLTLPIRGLVSCCYPPQSVCRVMVKGGYNRCGEEGCAEPGSLSPWKTFLPRISEG
jgi:hypothetical protein